MELRTIREKEKIEEAYFELLEHQNDELQIFVHDIQKHLENIGKLSDNSEEIKELFDLECKFTDIYNLGYKKIKPCGEEQKARVEIVK
mgnify:CR=1 FL=1